MTAPFSWATPWHGSTTGRGQKPDLLRHRSAAALKSGTLGVHPDHFAPSLVGLHHAVSLADLLEAEDSGGLDVEPTRCGVRRDLLQRHSASREARNSEDEAAVRMSDRRRWPSVAMG